MKFSEIIGQEDIKQRMMLMASEDRVPHAMMLCGAPGYGTLALAVAYASYLLGEREEGTNANVEAMLRTFQHPDLHFVYPVVKPSGSSSDSNVTSDSFAKPWQELLGESPYFTFEEWLSRMGTENQQAGIFAAQSDALVHKLSLKSSQGGYKVCVMWMPERMNDTFANKVLKLLEEPPQMTVFILVSDEPHKMLETIRSRVQRIDVKRIDDESMIAALAQRRGIEGDMAQRVAHVACGDWLKAVEFLDTANEKRQFHDMFVLLMRMAYQRDTMGMKKWADASASFGREKQNRMLSYFSDQIRENFMYNFGRPELVYMTEEEEAFSKNFARFISEANVIEIQLLIDKTIKAIGQNANGKMHFFDFALKMIVLIKRR